MQGADASEVEFEKSVWLADLASGISTAADAAHRLHAFAGLLEGLASASASGAPGAKPSRSLQRLILAFITGELEKMQKLPSTSKVGPLWVYHWDDIELMASLPPTSQVSQSAFQSILETALIQIQTLGRQLAGSSGKKKSALEVNPQLRLRSMERVERPTSTSSGPCQASHPSVVAGAYRYHLHLHCGPGEPGGACRILFRASGPCPHKGLRGHSYQEPSPPVRQGFEALTFFACTLLAGYGSTICHFRCNRLNPSATRRRSSGKTERRLNSQQQLTAAQLRLH